MPFILTSAPQRGQWIGIDFTVALSSKSGVTKLCPQWGHVTFFIPLNIGKSVLMMQNYSLSLPKYGSRREATKKFREFYTCRYLAIRTTIFAA